MILVQLKMIPPEMIQLPYSRESTSISFNSLERIDKIIILTRIKILELWLSKKKEKIHKTKNRILKVWFLMCRVTHIKVILEILNLKNTIKIKSNFYQRKNYFFLTKQFSFKPDRKKNPSSKVFNKYLFLEKNLLKVKDTPRCLWINSINIFRFLWNQIKLKYFNIQQTKKRM